MIFLFYCAAYSKLFLQTHKLRQCKNSLHYARKTCENLQMFWIQALLHFLLVDKYLLMYRLNDYGAHCFCRRRRCDDAPCSLHLYFHKDIRNIASLLPFVPICSHFLTFIRCRKRSSHITTIFPIKKQIQTINNVM